MFKVPNNTFANVKCPELTQGRICKVTNCLFSHPIEKRRNSDGQGPNKKPKTGTPESVHADGGSKQSQKTSEETLPKESPKSDISFVIPRDLNVRFSLARSERQENVRKLSKFLLGKTSIPNKDAIDKEYQIGAASNCLEAYRRGIEEALGMKSNTSTADAKYATPLDVYPSPALLPIRRKCVEHFVEALKKADPNHSFPLQKAKEEEYKIASSNSSATYNMAIRRRLYEINHPDKVKKNDAPVISRETYLRLLGETCISREKLIKFGYIMEIPPPIEEPKEVKQCSRCKNEFKLDDVCEKVICKYHSGRPVKNESKVRVYSCCGGVVGHTDTEPCTRADHHVFYWDGPSEMHHAIPFIETEKVWGFRKGRLDAIGIDCEMGFTSNGFELLRITAIDFFSGEEVLDILVRPKGEILDLNTRWSGVAEIKKEAVSFEDSIALLGEIVDANTVMIGHGLENDMNAMRLIHHRIVDTAVLYPKHKATPTFRYSLKQLAFQYLGRNIQSGEHDSGEDSLAAIDVLKHFLEQEYRTKSKT